MKAPPKAPCRECPFRKNCAPRWLGPWTAMSLHKEVMDEGDVACHLTVKEDGVDDGEVRHCMGSILYMNKNCKMSKYNRARVKLQAQFKDADTSNIMSVPEFFKKHGDL